MPSCNRHLCTYSFSSRRVLFVTMLCQQWRSKLCAVKMYSFSKFIMIIVHIPAVMSIICSNDDMNLLLLICIKSMDRIVCALLVRICRMVRFVEKAVELMDAIDDFPLFLNTFFCVFTCFFALYDKTLILADRIHTPQVFAFNSTTLSSLVHFIFSSSFFGENVHIESKFWLIQYLLFNAFYIHNFLTFYKTSIRVTVLHSREQTIESSRNDKNCKPENSQ